MQLSEEQQIAQALQKDWALQLPEQISEERILEQLEKAIMHMADRNPEAFFQLLYRLDVSEQKVATVLFEQDAGMQIAKLIYKRQLQKIESRKLFVQEDSDDGEDELKW